MKRLFALLLALVCLPCSLAQADELFFRPDPGAFGDPIPLRVDDKFYLFYLHAAHCKWAYTTTSNWVDFTPTTVLQDFGGTGDIVYHDGWYHLYASKVSANGDERIGHYCSKDLNSWTRLNESIAADPSLYVPWAWRDPRVFWHDAEQQWWMLVTSNIRADDGMGRSGCVALLTSDDLKSWRCETPLYSPRRYEGSFECPDYFQIGDWYYLLYSNASDGKSTHYVKSRSPRGPWQIPDTDTFDSVHFYAGKTVADSKNRYIVGWCGDRVQRQCLKLGANGVYSSDDYAATGYAGNAIVHRLVQADNGDLFVAPVSSMLDRLHTPCRLSPRALTGQWSSSSDGDMLSAQASAPDSMAIMQIAELPSTCHVSFIIQGDAKEMGFALHANDGFGSDGYYYALDRGKQQLTYTSGGRTLGGYGYYYPFDSELARSIAIRSDAEYQVDILLSGDLTVVYVNQQIALTARHAATESHGLYLTCYGGTARFSRISIQGI